MPVTWVVSPDRSRAELTLTDPYTFTEWEKAMLGVLETSASRQDLRIVIDRRTATPPTNIFVSCVVNFFRAHEPRLGGIRAAALVNRRVPEFLPGLRVGRFHIRTFDDAAAAEEWLSQDAT
jgi:hypothetical protein